LYRFLVNTAGWSGEIKNPHHRLRQWGFVSFYERLQPDCRAAQQQRALKQQV
jgi:hypothetical protein